MLVTRLTSLLTLVSVSSVLAGTVHVPQDQSTIQAGIDSASSGDTVLVADGTYSGEGNINIDFGGKLIVLKSENGPEVTIIDCQQAGRAFYFHSGEDSTARIEGFTIENGVPPAETYTGGGIHCENSSPSIIDCIFSNNVAASYTCPVYGGAVYAFGSTTHLSKCVFQDNAVWDYDLWGEGWGGAIAAQQSILTIDTCLFIGNRAEYGGALFASESSELAVENCTFYANSTGFEDAGSTLFLGNRFGPDMSTATLEKCIITYGLLSSAIQCSNSSNIASLACCNVFGNAGGDWIGCIAGQEDSDGNFSLNPEFCDTANILLKLNPLSPCLPEYNSCETLIGAEMVGCDCCRIRGDINHDGSEIMDISDLVYLVDYMFNGGTAPPCLLEANIDGSVGQTVDISDLVYTVDFMFGGGPSPAPCF